MAPRAARARAHLGLAERKVARKGRQHLHHQVLAGVVHVLHDAPDLVRGAHGHPEDERLDGVRGVQVPVRDQVGKRDQGRGRGRGASGPGARDRGGLARRTGRCVRQRIVLGLGFFEVGCDERRLQRKIALDKEAQSEQVRDDTVLALWCQAEPAASRANFSERVSVGALLCVPRGTSSVTAVDTARPTRLAPSSRPRRRHPRASSRRRRPPLGQQRTG